MRSSTCLGCGGSSGNRPPATTTPSRTRSRSSVANAPRRWKSSSVSGTDFDAWRAGGQRFLHRGHEIFYRVTGSGDSPSLLLIHGFPTASWDWHRLWPALSEQFARVIAADMIGFGYSAKPRDY